MADFKPILYVKEQCPFSFKARLFLLEAGLLDRFEVREFAPGSEEEQAVRNELEPHFEKVSFPTLQASPGEYINDSDAIVARYAQEARVDPDALATYGSYTRGVMRKFIDLFRENIDLRKQVEPV